MRRGSVAIRHRALGEIMAAHRTPAAVSVPKKSWIRAQQGGSATEDRLNMPTPPKKETHYFTSCVTDENKCAIFGSEQQY